MTASGDGSTFRLAFVPGVTPSRWVRTWHERVPGTPLTLAEVPAAEAAGTVRDGTADAVLLRLPIDRTGLHAIPLYTDASVVVIRKDHLVAAADEVSVEDLADDVLLHPLDDTLPWERLPGHPADERPATTADAIALVAAGAGLLVVPQSLARLHTRKDLTSRPVPDAPQSQVALTWPVEATTDEVEQFIGIIRGRTVNSTRGRPATEPPKPAQPDQPAKAAKTGTGQRKPTGGTPSARTRSRNSGTPQSSKRGKPRRRS